MGTNPPIFKFTVRRREIVSFEGYGVKGKVVRWRPQFVVSSSLAREEGRYLHEFE